MCAVAAGNPISREAFGAREGSREERMGNLAGDPVSAAQAVEAVQARDAPGFFGGGGHVYFSP